MTDQLIRPELTETDPGADGERSLGRSLRHRARSLTGLSFVSPSMIVMMLLVIYPLCYGIYISVFKTNLLNSWEFVGLRFYEQSLTDPDFRHSLITTVTFAFLVVAGHLIVGTALAVMLSAEVKFRTVWRAILMLPWLFPDVVVALIFRWIYDPLFGLLNYALDTIGLISEPKAFLDDPTLAFWAVVAAAVWKGYPLIMLLVLAGLQSIPLDRYKAAALDGAGRLRQFRYVSLPGLIPVLGVAVILDFVWWFKHFTVVWIMTAGGPLDATNVVSISIYRTAFTNFDFGRAAAMAVIVLVICIMFALIYRKLVPDDEA